MFRFFIRRDEFHICLVMVGSTLGIFLAELYNGKVFSSMYALSFWFLLIMVVGFLTHRIMDDLRVQYRRYMRSKRRARFMVRSLEVRK